MKPASSSGRLESIDLLRGLVVMLMALDHARDYFAPFPHAPEDLAHASPALFLTRWITHFCAPVFVFLAGTSIYLRRSRDESAIGANSMARGEVGTMASRGAKGSRTGSLSGYLLARGLWLIFLECTFIAAAWGFLFVGIVSLQVIWVLGVSMIVMAGLVRLRWRVSFIVGAVLVGLHNLLDPITSAGLADRSVALADLWILLHEQRFISFNPAATAPFTPPGVFVVYPLIPWIGVMALGYAFGRVVAPEPSRTKWGATRWCIVLGVVSMIGFIALRATNLYGDPVAFTRTGIHPVLDFLNTTKYPPSLQFLLMTLGPALLLLPVLPHLPRPAAELFRTFGRVPMFFYLLHIPLLHVGSAILWYVRLGATSGWQVNPAGFPPGYTPRLWVAYAAWAGAIAILWWPCRWFMKLRARRRDWWLSYL